MEAREFVFGLDRLDQLSQLGRADVGNLISASGAPLVEQLRNAIEINRVRIPGFGDHPGKALWQLVSQRAKNASEHFLRGEILGSTPLVYDDVNWEYVLHHTELNHRRDLGLTRGLQEGGRNPGFLLRNVTADQLFRLRREGALEGLRQRLRKAAASIEVASADDVPRISEEVNREVHSLLEEHRRELASHSDKAGYFGLELASLLGSMGLVIAGSYIDEPLLQVIGGLSGMWHGPGISGSLRSAVSLLENRGRLRSSAAAVLCQGMEG